MQDTVKKWSSDHGKNVVRIIVLEDNEFYNKILSKQLSVRATKIEHEIACEIEILCFTSTRDFFSNLENLASLDLAFVDFNLDDAISGLEVMKLILQQFPNCKVVIFSKTHNNSIENINITSGALEFLKKDRHTIDRLQEIFEHVIRSQMVRRDSSLFGPWFKNYIGLN